MGVAEKIFGMFDKVDDIIYEPIKLICDTLRYPLNKFTESNKQEFEMKLKKFEADLEIDKQRRAMMITVDERKLDEEINQMILDRDQARREELVQLEVRYRKEMAQAAAELAQIITNLQVTARSQVLTLYMEKQKEYLDLQGQYKKQMWDTVKSLRETFPDGSGEDIIQEEIRTQLRNISDMSLNFTRIMNADVEKVTGIIDKIVTDTTGITSRYFLANNQVAINQDTVAALES